jgi:hypothetical protein
MELLYEFAGEQSSINLSLVYFAKVYAVKKG